MTAINNIEQKRLVLQSQFADALMSSSVVSIKNTPAAMICTYMGRCGKKGKPFRFILNHSNATACNTYLMLYLKPVLSKFLDRQPDAMRAISTFLNEIETDNLIKLIPDLPMEKQSAFNWAAFQR